MRQTPFHTALSEKEFKEMRAELFELLRNLSYEWRDPPFTLKSGAKSNVYFDGRQSSLTPKGSYLIGRLFLWIIYARTSVRAIGGLSVGADPLVSAVLSAAYLSKASFVDYGFLVRGAGKDHGVAGRLVGGKHIPKGTCVAICDDVITSGGSMLEAVHVAQESSFHVDIALALVDRQEQDGLAKIRAEVPKTYALFTKEELSSGVLEPLNFQELLAR